MNIAWITIQTEPTVCKRVSKCRVMGFVLSLFKPVSVGKTTVKWLSTLYLVFKNLSFLWNHNPFVEYPYGQFYMNPSYWNDILRFWLVMSLSRWSPLTFFHVSSLRSSWPAIRPGCLALFSQFHDQASHLPQGSLKRTSPCYFPLQSAVSQSADNLSKPKQDSRLITVAVLTFHQAQKQWSKDFPHAEGNSPRSATTRPPSGSSLTVLPVN